MLKLPNYDDNVEIMTRQFVEYCTEALDVGLTALIVLVAFTGALVGLVLVKIFYEKM